MRAPIAACLIAALPAVAGSQARRALAEPDIADIATLIALEDRRVFDSTVLARILRSTHPEVRRRAALSVGRIVDSRGRVLLRSARGDADTAVAATVVFATGQLYDTASIGWLDSLLTSPQTPPTVAREAAGALGKIRTPETRAVLARYLANAPANARNAPVVGEALLSIGRAARGDIEPIVRWITNSDAEVRWRAAWALFRPRDPAAGPHLLRLSEDPSADVRNWAVRGLTAPYVDSAKLSADQVAARLRTLVRDGDRTVRTEALRALTSYADTASWRVIAEALESPDSWLSISAAEGLGRLRTLAAMSTPKLAAAASAPTRGNATRVTSLTALIALSPDAAVAPATAMARDTAVMVRVAAVNFFRTRGVSAREMLTALQNDPAPEVSGPARQAVAALADTTAAAAGGGGGGGRGGARGGGAAGGAGGGGRTGGGGRGRGPVQTSRTDADYRRIVERWIVPDYQGAPRPRAEWTTVRGTFEIELYPGDAPIGTDDFLKNVESGVIVGVDFSRVVPDFVDQQRGIPGHAVVRDEVNRNRLTRGNVSWASAGLDTGRPGYTLGHTPQPHNEGGFTSLGRVVRGMDVVDRIELGDRILAARMLR